MRLWYNYVAKGKPGFLFASIEPLFTRLVSLSKKSANVDGGFVLRGAMRDWHAKVYKKTKVMTRLQQEEWRDLRKAVLGRDYYTCVRCMKVAKTGRGLSVHHLLPRADGGKDDMDNLVTLCHKCHDIVELEGYCTIEQIIRSADDPVILPESKPINDNQETFERPAWHAWVYGGQRDY